MNAVQSTLDWNMDILLMNLTVRSSVLRIANTSTVVAPTSISTIIGACLETAVDSTITRLTPASAIHAQAVVGAVLNANRDGTIRAVEVGVANASSIGTFSVGTIAIIGADLDRAIEVCPSR
jgi:predicted component of type VI protein secretion system